MLTKTLSEAKKKQRASLIKAMNNDIGSIDSAKASWNPAQISERAKDISYIRSLVDSWNPAQLNEAIKMMDLPVIDTWNPAQIEEQRRNLVFYLAERTLTGNPITLKIVGNLTPEVTGLKVTMNPIQNFHGYDYPWVGGAGKNIGAFPKYAKQSTEGFTISVEDNGYIHYVGTAINSYAKLTNNIPILLSSGTVITFSRTKSVNYQHYLDIVYTDETHEYLRIYSNTTSATFTLSKDVKSIQLICLQLTSGTSYDETIGFQLEIGSTATDYAPYENICPISGRTEASVTRTVGEDEETKTHEYNETIWWATDDFKNGGMEAYGAEIASYDGETLPGEWMSDRDAYASGTTPTIGAQVVYKNTPTTIETTPEEITLLKGTNVLSTDGDSIELKYKQNF